MAFDDRPPVADITSEFETLMPSAAGGEPICRGTHQYESATVERTYHVDNDLLAAETAYVDGEETVEVLNECWLLDGDCLAHTGESVPEFCRGHHFAEPATDIAFCWRDPDSEERESTQLGEITSMFQPAAEVRIDEGAPLRFTASHESDEARIEREFFVDETREQLRVRTSFFWAEERLGSLTEQQALIDDAAFVATTGEPVDAFCRRTHLAEPEADLRYCARLGIDELPTDPAERR